MAEYKPLQEQAYLYLKDLIKNGKLVPGEIYSETRMSTEIGISRTPMKDALVRLSQDKYIDIIPSKGFQLHVMTRDDIFGTYQARTAVEGYCALHLSRIRDTAEGKHTLRLMDDSIQTMADLLDEGADISAVLDCDLQFHKAMVDAVENKELISLFELLNHRVSHIAMDSFSKPGRPQEALEEHKAIYQAILASKSEADAAPYLSVEQHMKASSEIALKHLE